MGLSAHIDVKIRFSETDAMGVVWHGNYLKFFEDAREHFGVKYGLEYLRMYELGYFTPIAESSIKHKSPIYYGQTIRIKANFIKMAAAKIKFEFEVINTTTNEIAAKGHTVQVFLDKNDRIMSLNKPEFFIDWESKQNWISLD